MIRQREIGSLTITLSCEDTFGAQAELLLDTLVELDQKPALQSGTTIQFGWSLLSLQGNEHELSVCEPNFDGDPFHEFNRNLDNTLRVLTAQATLMNYLEVEGVDVSFQENIVFAKGCLKKERIYLERQPVETTNDSGWYVGDVERKDPVLDVDELDTLHVYQLLKERPSLMQVLNLPTGYLVAFNGDSIEAIFNEDEQNIWST